MLLQACVVYILSEMVTVYLKISSNTAAASLTRPPGQMKELEINKACLAFHFREAFITVM